MDKNKRKAPLLVGVVMLAICLLVQPLQARGQGQGVSEQVLLPNQEYSESSEDIAVKALGGRIRIRRSWVAGQWYLNPAWASLRFVPDPLGGVLAINRAGSLYERKGGAAGQERYEFGLDNIITRSAEGWRWSDRQGSRIDYAKDGRVLSYANAAGVTVYFEYTAQGHLARILDHHKENALLFETDAQGRVTRVVDARDSRRSVSYRWIGQGAASRLSQVTDLLGGIWRYEYNASGSAVAASAATGSTRLRLPPIARVASLRNEAGALTRYEVQWSAAAQRYRLRIEGPDEQTSTRIYDSQGRLLQDSKAGLSLTDRVITGVPRPSRSGAASQSAPWTETVTDARGLITRRHYSAAGQLLQTLWPDGSSESNEYDAGGRRTRHTNALGAVSAWRYDRQGNETAHIQALGQPEQRATLSAYDAWGQLTGRTQGAKDGRGPDALTEHYVYDRWGNLIETRDAAGHSSRVSYNSQGLPLTHTDPEGRTTRYAWDAAGNLTSITNE